MLTRCFKCTREEVVKTNILGWCSSASRGRRWNTVPTMVGAYYVPQRMDAPRVEGFCNRLTHQRCYDHRKSGDKYVYAQPQEQRNGSDGWTRTSNGLINGAVSYHWATSEFV